MSLKFKVWCGNRNEWERHHCYLDSSGCAYQKFGHSIHYLDPETHQLFFHTGKADKNNLDIIDGHILKSSAVGCERMLFIVEWNLETISFDVHTKTGGCGVCIRPKNLHKAEIIGHIKTHSELLKWEEKTHENLTT